MSLNEQTCMVRTFLIDLNHVELKFFPFIVSLDKWIGTCNPGNDLSTKICIPSKKKDINAKGFDLTTAISKTKTLRKHVSSNFKCKFNSTTFKSNKNWNDKTC